MNIEQGKTYKIKGASEYFQKKYGTPNPSITIEGLQATVFGGKWWGFCDGNPAALLYGMRAGMELLPMDSPGDPKTYYGHIGGAGEIVHEDELEVSGLGVAV